MKQFHWSHRGKSANGNSLRLSGRTEAETMNEAMDKVDRFLRGQYPDVHWMHGKDIEGDGIYARTKFGPTLREIATPKAKRQS
jgi:hypothetical protein